MSDETSSVATETTTENTGMESSSPVASPQASEQTSPSQGTPANDGYNPKWYEQDGRFGKIWKKESLTDDFAKSYYNLEKQYKPLAEQNKVYNSTFKELGIEPQKLPEIYKEYQTLKDPNHPANKAFSYFDPLFKDPVYGPQLLAQLEQIEVDKLQKKYPNMNRAQIEKQMEMEQKLNKFEEAQKQQENEKYVQSFTAQLKQQVDKNQKLAESVGFVYTEDVHKAVMQAVAKHDQDFGYPMTAHEAFLSLYGDKIEQARAQKLEADFLKRQAKKGNSGSPAKSGKPSSPSMSLKEKFQKAFTS